MITDREAGVAALKIWFDRSAISATPITFAGVVARYDRESPDFLQLFGEATRYTDRARVERAMAAVAAKSGTRYPSRQSLFNALVDETKRVTFLEVAGAAAEGAKDAAKAATTAAAVGASIYALWVLGGVALFYLMAPKRGG